MSGIGVARKAVAPPLQLAVELGSSKILANSGDSGPPCGVPTSLACRCSPNAIKLSE